MDIAAQQGYSEAVDAIITMDHRGLLVGMNAEAELLFGFRFDDVYQRPVADVFVPARLRSQHMVGLSRYMNRGVGPVIGRAIEVPALHVKGHEFIVSMTINRVPDSDPPVFQATLQKQGPT